MHAMAKTVFQPRYTAWLQSFTYAGLVPVMLQEQFRMHPNLLYFPNKISYHGQIRSAGSCGKLVPPSGFPWPRGYSSAFVNCESEEMPQGVSFSNPSECATVLRIVDKFLTEGTVAAREICILAAYHPQVSLIKERMRQSSSQPAMREVHVSSIDAFQGRESLVFILSMVRSNMKGSTGLLNQRQRLNVAFTRARTGLIIVGNAPSLLRGDTEFIWKAFFKRYGALDEQRTRTHTYLHMHSTECAYMHTYAYTHARMYRRPSPYIHVSE